MTDKIRVGIVGATVTQGGSGWGANAHVPALQRAARLRAEGGLYRARGHRPGLGGGVRRRARVPPLQRHGGAPGRSTSSSSACGCPAIRTSSWPACRPARPCSASGRSARTWPRRRRWRAAPSQRGLKTIVGLQARSDPTLMYARDLIQEGYIGEVLTANLSVVSRRPAGARRRPHLAGRPHERRQHADDRRRPRHRRPVLRAGRV